MALPPGFVLEEPRINLPQGFVLETAPSPPEKQSAFRQIADVPLGIAKGAVQGVRMIADAFGAGSNTSNTIKSAENYLADLMSAQAKNDQQEISRIMKDAEDKGVLDQVKAGVKAFTVAPVDTLSSALGTAAPVIVGALGAKILGAGALATTGVSALTGAGMGAGVVKGSIYEETKRALKEAGASEKDAEARAQLAQEYGGKNLDQILLGTVLGGAAAIGPLEKGAAGILARRILGKTEGTEAVAGQAVKGAARRRLEAGALEAVPEMVQAGQEQVAQNIALQREGFDVPTFRGAVSAATLEGLAGAGLGAAFGGGKPEVAPAEPVAPTPEAPVAPEAPVKPMVDRVMEMAAQRNGYGLLEQQKQRLLTEPKTDDVKEELTFIQEIQDRMNIETAQRATPSGKSPFIVTPKTLTELGISPTAPIIKRLDGKFFDDPVVVEQLEKFAANKNVDPEVQQNVLSLVEKLRQPEPPVEPAPVSEAPTVETAPPVTPAPVEPVAEAAEVEPSVDSELVTPTVETPAPAVEMTAPPVEAAAPPAPEIDQKALEEKRQMVADMIETKKANREPVPEAWVKKLADLSAQLRGETISEGETYSMEVAGHPLFDGPPVLRNLIPIKVKDSDAAQRALDRALDLEKQFATEFYGARQALSVAKTAAQKKAAQARVKKLNDQGWDEDALQTLRNETIQELSRLVDVTQKAAPKAEAPAVEAPTPAAETPVAPEIAPLQDAYNKAKSALDAIGTEPAKPSPEARYFGVKGREGAAPELVRAYDEKVKAYNSWRRKYLKLKKEEVEASNVLFRAKQAQELKSLGKAEAKQNFQQALRPLLNKFGLKDVELKIEEGMDDDGSYSQQLIRLAAQQANPVRTLRHESVHALRELGFFTDAQWKSLSKMAKDKWVDQYLKQRNVQGRPLKEGEESRYDAYMREYNGDMEKITEEAVADAFADFDATKPPAGLIQALLKRMKDLFQSIKSALTKVESPEQIFGKVEKGELKPGEKRQAGERKSVRDRATANFLRWFGDSKVVDEKGEPLVVYHGTTKSFDTFMVSPEGKAGAGIYLSADPQYANMFGGTGSGKNVMPLYVSMKRPFMLKQEQGVPVEVIAKSFKEFEGLDPYSIDSKIPEVLSKYGYDGVIQTGKNGQLVEVVAFRPEQIKSAIGNNGDYSLTNPDIRKSLGKATDPGQQALETIRSMGMDVPKPDETKLQKAQATWEKAKENPKLTAQSAARAVRNFLDKVETWSFSSDAKLNNDFRRAVINDIKKNEGVIGQLLEMSQSQAVHADALASQFMIEGGLKYNEDLKKWESFDAKANFPALSNKLDEIGKKYNLSKEQIDRVAHAYLVAKRLPGLIERNSKLDEEIKAEEASAKPDKKKIQDLKDKKVFVTEKQLEQVEPGLSLAKTIPELDQVVDMWNEIRKNTIDVMVNSGLWSPEYAQAMWDNMDYVPYYREDQIENEAGPQEFIKGLQVKSKEFQLKGSDEAVHDVFDNMIRWTQYAINRSVRAHKALQMVDNAQTIPVGDRKMAEKVTEEKRGMNIVRVFRDGKQELYDMADPLYVQAFSGIQNVAIPTINFMARVSNVLRNSVVLYPLFSVAQVPQDSFAAMFTSGLKTQHALKIPYLAVKEFVKTLAKTSQTHETLKKFGATGVRDFSATVIRDDAEIYAGLKPPRGGWGKTKEVLSHISMAADNAVRQAVYEASIQQGVNRAEAIEKAFDVINFRRKGTSKMLNILGQTVPFFYAYLSAQRVAYKVLTGVGISPTDRLEAGKTLAMTSAAVATLSLLYAMANGDDEDYMETPANIRDRTITIPGSGGVRIPLRPDFFLFPKIIAEHTYLMLAEKGYQDAAKFKTSMKDALISAIASPTPFPTAIKPAIEVAINYDFFQGKPLIGNFEKQKDLERQFRDSTSEFSKLLGATGMVSPIAADHLIRGMFGSFGGLFLYGTNQFLHSDPDVPRPELSAGEMLTALPGTSGLLKRPQESALKNDFFLLRDEVEKAVNTFNDIKTRSPQGMEDFLDNEKMMARYMLGKPVDQINRQLSKIRRQMTIITNMPESMMSAAEKADFIRELREYEREYLKSVDVKALREMAKI